MSCFLKFPALEGFFLKVDRTVCCWRILVHMDWNDILHCMPCQDVMFHLTKLTWRVNNWKTSSLKCNISADNSEIITTIVFNLQFCVTLELFFFLYFRDLTLFLKLPCCQPKKKTKKRFLLCKEIYLDDGRSECTNSKKYMFIDGFSK